MQGLRPLVYSKSLTLFVETFFNICFLGAVRNHNLTFTRLCRCSVGKTPRSDIHTVHRCLKSYLTVSRPLALSFDDPTLRNDHDVVMEAVKQNGYALQFAGYELRQNRDVVLEAVRQTRFALMCAHKELRCDYDIVMEAVKKTRWWCVGYKVQS